MVEVWRPIPDYPGYEASDHGRIRSVDRVIFHKDIPVRLRGKILKQMPHPDGHLMVTIGGKKRWVHRLVLFAFVGECPENQESCHNDNDPANNRETNLRYDTRVGNWADRKR